MRTNANGRRDADGLIVTALSVGASYADAARIAGVSKATVARRMAEPAFRARVLEDRDQLSDQVRGMLVDGSLTAARSLVELAEGAASEAVRSASARSRNCDLRLRLAAPEQRAWAARRSR